MNNDEYVRLLLHFCHQSVGRKSSSDKEQHAGAVAVDSEGAAGDAESVVLEPKLDPEMEKYMTIVRQQREKEKLEKQVGLLAELIGCWVALCYFLFLCSVLVQSSLFLYSPVHCNTLEITTE